MSENTDDAKKEFAPITTQEELDKIVGSRVMRERDKYRDYEELKTAAQELAKLKDENKSELEKAISRAEKAEKELTSLQHEKQLSDVAKEVSKETGVPLEALRGNSKEELLEHASLLKQYMKKDSVPYVASDGNKPTSDAAKTHGELFASLFNH